MSESRAETPTYVRTQGGRMIHRADCKKRGRNAARWTWADGRTVGNILAELDAVGLSYNWCAFCFHHGSDIFDAMMENNGYEKVSTSDDGLERWELVQRGEG